MDSRDSHRIKTLQALRNARPCILPSLLLCDFGNLEREVRRLEDAGVTALHLDVMDGRFVPNLTYGMPIVEAIRRLTDMVVDVHLMIEDPAKFATAFVNAGADAITFHREAVEEPMELLTQFQEMGVATGLAYNPKTELDANIELLQKCDLLLVMSVEAGFGGQAFDPNALVRINTLRQALGDQVLLEVDGGINLETIGPAVAAGVDLIVVGSAIFRQADYSEAVLRLRQAAQVVS